jgi:DNA-binding transcriptional LysR family regulator
VKDDRLIEMRVFKAVAELGGFTAAAHALSATQPFVSRTVKTLEERLGITLLRRSTRHLSLTSEGEHFLASTNKLLAELDVVEADVSNWRSEVSGQIRLTAPTNFGVDQIVPLLPHFLATHPNVRVNLSLSDTVVDLFDGRFDIAVRMGRLQGSMLVSRKLTDLQRVVVASPKYIRERGMPKHPNDLANHNCLRWDAPLDHLNHWPFVIDGKKVSLAVTGNFQCISGVASASMCTASVGIGRMAEHLALPAIRRGELIPLLQEFQAVDELGIFAVFVRERSIHPRIRVFVDYLVDRFKNPPWVDPAFNTPAA